jgi:hypothetical protein
MSDSARHNLLYVLEATRGVTPTASPTLKDLRHTSCNMKLAKGTNKSAELHQDGQIRHFRHGAKQVNGDIGLELSYSSFDDILEAVMGGTWAAKATKTATTISAAGADNSYNDSGNGFVTAGFEVGDKVTVSGFTGNVANNIAKGVITALTAGKMTIGGTDGDVIVDDAAGESVTIVTTSSVLKLGTTRRYFTLIRHFSDLAEAAKPYHFFPGCEFTALSLTATAEALVTGQVSVLGIDQDPVGTLAALTTPTIGNPTTTEPFDSFTGSVLEGGASVGIVTELAFNLATGKAARFVIGSDNTQTPTVGQLDVTGTVTTYFEDASLVEKFLNETSSSIRNSVVDPAGNEYEFRFPKVKYNDAPTDVSGQGAITVALPFQALYDETTGTTFMITRKPV